MLDKSDKLFEGKKCRADVPIPTLFSIRWGPLGQVAGLRGVLLWRFSEVLLWRSKCNHRPAG